MNTVTACTKKKMWQDKQIYTITLSDGTTGDSFSDIAPGTPDTDLTIEDGQYGKKIKLNKKNGFAGGGMRAKAGNESFALSYSKDLVVAGKVDIKDILPVADKLYNWLESKKK
jgi:hypothetical protein